MHASFSRWGKGLFLLAIGFASFASTAVDAQSIRIQTGGRFGGFQLGINTAPGFGYAPRYGYGGYAHPGYGIGYGIGGPYSSYRYGYPNIYDTYRAQSMYRDYRADYYDRLMSSYRYGIQRDLMYDVPHYQSPYRDPLIASPYGYPSYQPPVAQIEPFFDYRDQQIVAPEPAARVPVESLPESLRAAATRLSASLSRRQNDGEIWLDYLTPGKIVQAIDQGLPADSLRELARNYDGVVGNPELRAVANADGFAKTRQLLHQWINAASTLPTNSQPSVNAKPAVPPEPMPEDPGSVEPEFAEPAPEESILDDAIPSEVDENELKDTEQVPAVPRVRVSV